MNNFKVAKLSAIFACLFLFFFFFSVNMVGAETKIDPIYIFTSPTCPHCASAKDFLKKIEKENNLDLQIHDFTMSQNTEKAKEYYERYSVPFNKQGLVPAIFIGDKYFIGFNDKIGEEISALMLGEAEENKSSKEPFLSENNLSKFSLPMLAIVLGLADGFNVCSLGALLVILGLVMVLRSRKKIFLMGGVFILTTGFIYGLMIFLWHQFFSRITPYVRSMEMALGLLSLVGGLYLLREFYKAYKNGPICSSNNLISRLSPKIEKIFKNRTNWAILLGAVIIFSALVTIIEFPCSAFLPVIFSGILANSHVSLGLAVLYMCLYLLFYMLDEILIFLIAVFTLKIKITSPKFIIFFNLLAALIFIFTGAYYLFGWLA